MLRLLSAGLYIHLLPSHSLRNQRHKNRRSTKLTRLLRQRLTSRRRPTHRHRLLTSRKRRTLSQRLLTSRKRPTPSHSLTQRPAVKTKRKRTRPKSNSDQRDD